MKNLHSHDKENWIRRHSVTLGECKKMNAEKKKKAGGFTIARAITDGRIDKWGKRFRKPF